MANNDTRYTAIECSSKAVRLVHGYTQDNMVIVLYSVEVMCNAIEGGRVQDIETLTQAIKNVIESASSKLEIQINQVLIALPPVSLNFCRDNATTKTISPDNSIGLLDITNDISLLKKTRFEDRFKIVDVIPYRYVYGNNENSERCPIGKISDTVTVHGAIYALENNLVEPYVKACNMAGLEVIKTVITPCANGIYMATQENMPKDYFLLDIGSEMTFITQIVQNNVIIQNVGFKYGSENITNKLANKLNLTSKEARILKEKYGMDKAPSFRVNVYKDITLNQINAIISESINPLIAQIDKQIKAWNPNNVQLPLVLVGGGSSLFGFKELLEEKLGMEVIDFVPTSIGARSKSFITCLGLIKYADQYLMEAPDNGVSYTSITRVQSPSSKNRRTGTYDIDEEL